ncbi:DUF3311 domain-containing protein [Haloferax sp. MBLA0076]|uniref:DUF3311 domain-containing protein n=1 Tax=Haloferax litoreum TaxID=2666140 RepID=A0A6A8GGA8_9EURY|nr:MULTISPECIES: DUF3311 domain-containing protein [Haloferax]KAB1193395.1 DUF3311 domain-containing protein [Haloferax sp. CBA1148]MRX21906.1 DUF3311 domain-containing protein [Haloferax litoreum]
MTRARIDYLWIATFAVLVTFAVPWFLWGDSRVFAGLPLWLWWHIGWMGLTAVVFHLFTRRAWDRGIVEGAR